MLISAQHKELLEKYNQLVLRQYQHDEVIRKKDEENAHLAAQITPLKNAVEQMRVMFVELQQQHETLLSTLADKEKQLDGLLMIKYQYDQLQKLVYGRSSEKSHTVLPGQLLLGLDAQLVEACSIRDGQKVEGYTKYKPTNEKHPGRNKIPAHVRRVYVDLHPENLPEGAQQYGKKKQNSWNTTLLNYMQRCTVDINTSSNNRMVLLSSSSHHFQRRKIKAWPRHH